MSERADSKDQGVPTNSKLIEIVQSALAWALDAAVDGVPGTGTLDEFVNSYYREGSDPESAIDNLVSWQVGKAGTAGFITGLGGIITLPASIPANLVTVLFLQLRMIATIAKIRGYDVRSDQVRTLCVASLAGSAMTDILKDAGIRIGTKFTQQAIMKITGATLVRVNQAVGFRLVTKAGSTGILNLTKMVPLLGAVVGGTFDAVSTKIIAAAARSMFTQVPPGPVVTAAAEPDPIPR